MKKLIIIPAFNEEKNLVRLIDKIKISCSDYDYIIINDGSTDKTLEVCLSNNFNVINLPINLGIGGCMQTGYKYAYLKEYDIAVQIDGDGQHNPDEINTLFKFLKEENSDIVIGSRFIKKNGYQSTFMRRLGIRYFSKLINILTKGNFTDITSGFRMCNKIAINLFANTYPIDYPEPESIVIAAKKKFKINEVPTIMNKRTEGISSISWCKAIYYIIKVTLSIIITFYDPKY